jgi:PhnB protein
MSIPARRHRVQFEERTGDLEQESKNDRGAETMAVKPIPAGFHSATPYLMVKNAVSAIEFYKKVFGASEIMRMPDPSGNIAHAEIRIGDSVIMLADESPERGNRGPRTIGGTSVFIALYVDDVDAVARQAVACGANLLIPVADQFYGDRSGRLEDPFGHIWIVATHKEDVTPDEMQKRFQAMMKK